MTDTYGMSLLTEELTLDEGRRKVPYFDTRHILTGGIGRNLGRGFLDSEIELMFANDVAECCYSLDSNCPWWRSMTAIRQRVMINLCFNLGWSRLAGFVHFLAAMQARDWQAAAEELKDSRWFAQVGDRGPRVIARLLGTAETVA